MSVPPRSNDAKIAMPFFFRFNNTHKKEKEEKRLFVDPAFRHSSAFVVGLLFGNNETKARSHGNRKATWFPHLLVCEFEKGMKS